MNTVKLFISSPPMIPPTAAWYLSDLGEALGKQELFTRQSSQKLKTLREHALIESAVSSNRLEGVTVDRFFTFKEAYKELEERVGQLKSPRGAKRELVLAAISGLKDDFSISDIQAKCPGVSVYMIRKVLKKERDAGAVECLGRGRDAKWHQIAKTG